MKKTFLLIIFLIVLISSVLAIYKNFKSGTVIWSQKSNPGFGPDNSRVITSDGSYLYIVGSSLDPPRDAQWILEKRRLSDGSLVENFGENGVITSNPSSWFDRASSVATDSDYLYIAGSSSPRMHDRQWRIEKRNLSDGSLVFVFGENGVVTSNPSYSPENVAALAIDINFLYVVGNEQSKERFKKTHHLSDYQWRIEKRRLSDGSLVEDFGENGVVTSNPNKGKSGNTLGHEGAYAIAIDSSFMYVIGKDDDADRKDVKWRIEKRRLSDGSFVEDFGENGVITSNPSLGFDEAHAIAIDLDFMYVAGHDSIHGSANNAQWRIEKRRLSDGSLVEDFGENGVITSNPSDGVDWAHGIILDKEYPLWKRIFTFDLLQNRKNMFIIGEDDSPRAKERIDHTKSRRRQQHNRQWRIEKRRIKDGSLVSSFGTEGVVTINPGIYRDSARSVYADLDYVYVVGNNSSLGQNDPQWQIVKITR